MYFDVMYYLFIDANLNFLLSDIQHVLQGTTKYTQHTSFCDFFFQPTKLPVLWFTRSATAFSCEFNSSNSHALQTDIYLHSVIAFSSNCYKRFIFLAYYTLIELSPCSKTPLSALTNAIELSGYVEGRSLQTTNRKIKNFCCGLTFALFMLSPYAK